MLGGEGVEVGQQAHRREPTGAVRVRKAVAISEPAVPH
jgi:hypothetical protein